MQKNTAFGLARKVFDLGQFVAGFVLLSFVHGLFHQSIRSSTFCEWNTNKVEWGECIYAYESSWRTLVPHNFYLHSSIVQYIPQKMGSKGVDHVAIIVTIGNSWLFAEIFTAAGAYNERPQLTQFGCRTDRSGLITATRWISLLNQLQWGTPSFNAGDIFAMIAASLVAIVERSISLRNMLKLFWI
ncbi:nucleobase-ascorbate transporter 4-like isoform X1 [Vicia villosa]|uniref:nucleobase-ascorbate transporter 4-like isoform X1 n=1 Tax=Vicia villosa TaxID=3911 RepID=UPI00273B5D37|nr:nucleobase-ascorbate transporter 4-like isoform X1 [Vicia villosa]